MWEVQVADEDERPVLDGRLDQRMTKVSADLRQIYPLERSDSFVDLISAIDDAERDIRPGKTGPGPAR
jgi:hypothetical protein